MMPDSFFENVYDLLVSYGETPRAKVLQKWRLLPAQGSSKYGYFLLDKISFVEYCPFIWNPGNEIRCNTIAFKCDKSGYCYVCEDTKRHPKTAPIQEINKQIQSLREKYLTLPAFW